MIDTGTKKKITVSTDGTAGPYIMVLVEQLAKVRAILDANAIPYWVDEAAISLNGKPEVTVVNLSQGCDSSHVQDLLDQEP